MALRALAHWASWRHAEWRYIQNPSVCLKLFMLRHICLNAMKLHHKVVFILLISDFISFVTVLTIKEPGGQPGLNLDWPKFGLWLAVWKMSLAAWLLWTHRGQFTSQSQAIDFVFYCFKCKKEREGTGQGTNMMSSSSRSGLPFFFQYKANESSKDFQNYKTT